MINFGQNIVPHLVKRANFIVSRSKTQKSQSIMITIFSLTVVNKSNFNRTNESFLFTYQSRLLNNLALAF